MLSIAVITIFCGILITTTNAVPYSKYGRSCKDIGCRSNEVCVMAEDPCSIYQRDSCGRYPTCQLSNGGAENCLTKICPTGQYCKTDNGRPTCINTTPALAYESAGVSAVNGQRTVTDEQPKVPADPPAAPRNTNLNPYAHASAPSEELDRHGNYPSYGNINPVYPPHPVSHNVGPPSYPGANNNYGYPAYPSNNNNHNNNNNYGYPQYPSSGNTNNNNNNNNRPAVPVDRYGYPIYPPASGHPPDNRYHNTYPQHNLPQHNPGWNNAYSKNIFRVSGASSVFDVSGLLLFGSFMLSAFSLRVLRM